VPDDRLDGGDDLDGAAPRADDRDAAPGEVDVVAPLGGVERGAFEALEPGERRHGRHRQLTAGGEQHVGLVRAGARLQLPRRPLRVPARLEHLGPGPDAVEHAVAGGDGVGVVVPDAADALAALEDRDVLVARAAQQRDRADAAEAAADDGDRWRSAPIAISVGNATHWPEA
jgi:hypothetical protein